MGQEGAVLVVMQGFAAALEGLDPLFQTTVVQSATGTQPRLQSAFLAGKEIPFHLDNADHGCRLRDDGNREQGQPSRKSTHS
jgi:hypothetical protein